MVFLFEPVENLISKTSRLRFAALEEKEFVNFDKRRFIVYNSFLIF